MKDGINTTANTEGRVSPPWFGVCDRARPAAALALLHSGVVSTVELQGWANPLKSDVYQAEVARLLVGSLAGAEWAHGPYCGLSAGSAEPLQRSMTLERYQGFQRAVAALGIRRHILHFNYNEEIDKPDKWRSRFVAFWRDYLVGQDDDVLFLHENSFEQDPQYLASVMREMDDSRMGVCLDVGHVQCMGGAVDEWLEVLGPWIRYFHVHDNHGRTEGRFYERDEHLPPGAGTVDWDMFMWIWRKRFARAPLALECGTRDVESAVRYLSSVAIDRSREES